jgi:hypothetical protein
MNLLSWVISRHAYLLVVGQLDSTSPCLRCLVLSVQQVPKHGQEVLIHVFQYTIVIKSFGHFSELNVKSH